MKLIPVIYYGFTGMDRRFSSPMLPWVVSEIRKRDYNEKLSLGIEDGVLQAYNQDFELQFSHKLWQITRFSQADQDATTFLYLMRDDSDTLLYCYLFQAKKAQDVLLKIDEILDPKVRSPVKNASAFDFLQNYYKWKISDHKVGIFADKVKHCHICTKLFKNPGRNTYFVPIDANLDYAKTHDLDRYIIEGHVVPNHVLFTRPAEKNSIFETHANSNFVYIVIVLSKDPHTRKLLVKSSTVLGSDSHRKGDVLSEILVENIPVTNGVVHLISQPLGIFKKALTVFPYLPTKYKIESDPDLSISWEFAKRSQLHKFFDYNDTRKFTYFVPNNHAWRRLFQIYGSDPFDSHSDRSNRKVGEILGRHLIASMRRWYTIEDLVKSSENFNNHTIISSTSGQIPLKFFRDYYGYHILWNGKQVNVIRPNYECADGIVHILDGVLVDLVEFEKFEDEDESKGGFWAVLKDFVSN